MSKQLAEAVRRRKAAGRALEVKRQQIKETRRKIEMESPTDFQASIEQAQANYKKASHDYALGEIVRDRVEEARQAVETAKVKASESVTVKDGLEDVLADQEGELVELKKQYEREDVLAWRTLATHLEEEVRRDEGLSRKLYMLHLARGKGLGSFPAFGDFCGDLFKDNQLLRSRELEAELEQTYLS